MAIDLAFVVAIKCMQRERKVLKDLSAMRERIFVEAPAGRKACSGLTDAEGLGVFANEPQTTPCHSA